MRCVMRNASMHAGEGLCYHFEEMTSLKLLQSPKLLVEATWVKKLRSLCI